MFSMAFRLCLVVMGVRCAMGVNVVMLIAESFSGRTGDLGMLTEDLDLAAMRKLQRGEEWGGLYFASHYVNAPVCCPSRASLWSGRLPHKIRHEQRQGRNSILVNGVWNNFEGLPERYEWKISDVLEKEGYQVGLFGKRDWTTGSHSLNVRLDAWLMSAQFPYDIPRDGGWVEESLTCSSHGSISERGNVYEPDWFGVSQGVAFMKRHARAGRPFFVYQGMQVAHPGYNTNRTWLEKVPEDVVDAPAWQDLEELHPCDLQSAMLKGCTPSNEKKDDFYSLARRKRIRRIYYAMVVAFDAMLGRYMDAVTNSPAANSTVFIVTGDHGDMAMEHQQHYKMVPYDPSSRVPLIIAGRPLQKLLRDHRNSDRVVTKPTEHVDLFPTVLELAGIPRNKYPSLEKYLDGSSLLSFFKGIDNHREFVTSQFHGDNLAMSWFLVRSVRFKLVVYGTGSEISPQLFDLENDPGEMNDLCGDSRGLKCTNASDETRNIYASLETVLWSIIDYPSVSLDVAEYNWQSFNSWANLHGSGSWEKVLKSLSLRWPASWSRNPQAVLKAISAWNSSRGHILP